MTKLQFAGTALAAVMAVSLGACDKMSAKPAADTGKISDSVKADVAQLVADFNAHDAVKTASHDAPDVVQMNHGMANIVGKDADLAFTTKGFAADPSQHVTDNNGAVDVAASGDMAVYRSTYVFTGKDAKTGKAMTETGNYLAGYRQQPDGTWKMTWSVVSDAPAPAPAAPATAPTS